MNKKNANRPSERPPSPRSQQGASPGLYISSWSALEEYLRGRPQAIESISCPSRDEQRLRELLAKYANIISVKIDSNTQASLAAQVKIEYGEEEAFFAEAADRTQDLIIACDHITDTRNLGAIARSAAFFGCRSLLMPKDRQAPITGATLGAAQGAFAHVEPVAVINLGRALQRLKDCGYWILSADMTGEALDRLPQVYEKTVLVLGAEDKGVSPNILSKSDVRVSIPSPTGNLDSLNVSVAAGILIHALYLRLNGTQKKSLG